MTAGTFTVVGLGPGDPDLLTLKAARAVADADVVAYHRGPGRSSIARSIVAEMLDARTLPAVEEELVYPVTTGSSSHPLGYHGELADFYLECTRRLAEHLERGRSVALLAEGDPFFYGSAMYVHDALAERFETIRIPGVTSMAAATASVGAGLCRHEDVLTVLPGTLPVPELARRLADTEAAVIMKLGRTFAGVREALRQAGLLERAVYVERASRDGERVLPVVDVDPDTVPYMALVVVPGEDRRADAAGRATAAPSAPAAEREGRGIVHVVGLGPGPKEWLSPQASEVLAQVSHVIGYAPYVERVPQRAGLTRHVSGNTVEVDRGTHALQLAAAGEDVAVVSGGDPGVFAMASAVFEAREKAGSSLGEVAVHVVPGITAAHAASALAGAVLGGDHALLSLSDRLKPWSVIEARLRALAQADLAMAFYNPRSASRPHQFGEALDVLRAELPAERVAVVARRVGRDGEQLHITTLGAFDPNTVDMGCLVMIGASSTRVTADGRVWTPRSVTRA